MNWYSPVWAIARKAGRQYEAAPTLADVAKAAGVSAMTVSRVINGGAVRPATEAKVRAAIRKLNYTPNEAARALAQKRSEPASSR